MLALSDRNLVSVSSTPWLVCFGAVRVSNQRASVESAACAAHKRADCGRDNSIARLDGESESAPYASQQQAA